MPNCVSTDIEAPLPLNFLITYLFKFAPVNTDFTKISLFLLSLWWCCVREPMLKCHSFQDVYMYLCNWYLLMSDQSKHHASHVPHEDWMMTHSSLTVVTKFLFGKY